MPMTTGREPKLTDRQKHPMKIAAVNPHGEIGWLGPLDVTRNRWLKFMQSLVRRGWFTYCGYDTFALTDAGRAALSLAGDKQP
jgi:hypothetical protein